MQIPEKRKKKKERKVFVADGMHLMNRKLRLPLNFAKAILPFSSGKTQRPVTDKLQVFFFPFSQKKIQLFEENFQVCKKKKKKKKKKMLFFIYTKKKKKKKKKKMLVLI